MTQTPTQACIRRKMTLYTIHCKCAGCRRQRIWVKKRLDHGVKLRRVSNEDALAVIDRWVALDWSEHAVASVVDISPNTIHHWLGARTYGKPMRLGPLTAEAVVNSQHLRATAGQVGTTIATRQLQALARMSWGGADLARRAPVLTSSTLYGVRRGTRRRVAAAIANAIDDLYTELNGRRGNDRQAELAARGKRWYAPADWDDITDLDEQPHNLMPRAVYDLPVDMTAVERLLACQPGSERPYVTKQERRQAVALGILRGMGQAEFEARTGINPALHRYNIRWATPDTTVAYAWFVTGRWQYAVQLEEAAA